MSIGGVLVISFGGPHKSEDIRPFLRDVLAGRPVPEARFESVVQHYELLGGRSPITEHTERQASALALELAERGIRLPVRVGMRHWTPWLREALTAFMHEGVDEVVGVIMAAQETEASLARYQEAVERARSELGEGAPKVRYASGWGLSEGVIEANACNVARTLARVPLEARASTSLLFTAHSIPAPMAAASPYVAQLEDTARRVAEKVGFVAHRLVYQSRSGSPRDPWLEPDVCDALGEEAARGARDVLLAPIGFLCDHVEVLFDLDIEAKQRADELGLRLHRAATVSAHPAFIAELANAVQRVLEA
ncbi:MAG: Ferrochelatase [Myxococcaceae bacterium]|nr:Ferrochelatase [Myxococcaceae bacterium]